MASYIYHRPRLTLITLSLEYEYTKPLNLLLQLLLTLMNGMENKSAPRTEDTCNDMDILLLMRMSLRIAIKFSRSREINTCNIAI